MASSDMCEQILMVLGNKVGPIIRYQSFDFAKKKWSKLQDVPDGTGMMGFDSAILNDKIYFTTQFPNSLQVFDPTTKLNTMFSNSSFLPIISTCACNQYVYWCGANLAANVLRYDPLNNSFERLARMQTARSSAAAIFYQGCLYVLGGNAGDIVDVDLVEKYDPDTKTWTDVPSMCNPRRRHAAAVLDGKLYACGGCVDGENGSKSVEVYDQEKNCWQLVASMKKCRSTFTLITRGDKLLAVGGDKKKTVEVYDPNKDKWKVDREMSSGLQLPYPQGGLISTICVTGDN